MKNQTLVKWIVIIHFAVFYPVCLFSQGVVVTEEIGTVSPDASSIMDVRSTTKGLLIPRMTTTQRAAITSPVNGLLVYDLTENQFFYYDEAAISWVKAIGPQGPQGFLSPGTAIGNVPYWNGTQWVLSSNNLFHNGTRVGIGTTAPSQNLDVNGALRLRGHLFDFNNSFGTVGQVLTRAASGLLWAIPAGNVSGNGVAGKVAYWENASNIAALPLMNYNTTNQFVEVTSKTVANDDDPIFEVRNKDGLIVLGVYQTGVRVYVDDSNKSGRGGFAVGGFTTQKDKAGIEYLRVTPDSVRVYTNNPVGKTARGGFAVGGFTTGKGFQDLLHVTVDSTRIYIDDTPVSGGKTARGGFAVGGFTSQKGLPNNFFNVETTPVELLTPSEARIIWDPIKNAFLAGQVLVESPLDVGQNSFSIGFENKAKGAQSQAMGYKSEAWGDYSTAIGKQAFAQNTNSFAFGDGAKSLANDAYAFGTMAEASGAGSFAFGSMGRDSTGVANSTMPTRAHGDYSVALGLGAQSISNGAFALGTNVVAQGPHSVAMGFNSNTNGFGSVAMGWGSAAIGQLSFASGFYSVAQGQNSISMGYLCRAQGDFAFAAGNHNIADGVGSVALGYKNVANSSFETVIGSYNQTYTAIDPFTWNPMDRLFVIGNGTELTRSNALVMLKNGNTGLGTNNPGAYKLYVSGDAYATGIWQSSDLKFKTNIAELKNTLEKVIMLRGVSFNWDAEQFPEMKFSSKKQIGFIAQEVESFFPELVFTNDDGYKAISYTNMTAVLLEAIKDLKKENDLLKDRLFEIEKMLKELK